MLASAILLPVLLASCGKEGQEGEKKTVQKSEDDFLDKDAKPDERKYLLAAKPFVLAVANRKYADAYALLSRYAIARMSLEQFKPSEQDSDAQQNQAYVFDNVTAEQFAYLMQYVEAAYGAPRAPKMLHVFSTNPDVLNRRSKEQFGAMDSMFAGNRVATLPLNFCFFKIDGAIIAKERFMAACRQLIFASFMSFNFERFTRS